MTVNIATDLFDYIFQFPDLGSAQRDLVVGRFPFSEVLVYNPVHTNSVVPLSGYWGLAVTTGLNSSLQASPNVQVVNDRTLMMAGQPSVLNARISISDIYIMFSIVSIYIPNGLKFAVGARSWSSGFDSEFI